MSHVDDNGVRVFELTAEESRHEFASGREVDAWGFNGAYLDPTLRAEVGEEIRVDVLNDLPEATTVNWHGMRLPAAMDGGPRSRPRTWASVVGRASP
ncbi:MAG: multicopper oxidase domain-containing protein [Gaiellales bacterium]